MGRATVKARDTSHKSRYEICSKVLEDLRSVRERMLSIDLRACPVELRAPHHEARRKVDDAIRDVKAACEGELDILDGRSEGNVSHQVS